MSTWKIAGAAVGIVLSLLFVFFSFPMSGAHAQTASPQVLVTWKVAGSYVPPFYADKAFPTYGSTITASVMVFANGRSVDLSSQNVYWYLNDTLVGGGPGGIEASFPPLGTPPDSLSLRVEIPQYPGDYIMHTVQIPFVDPVAVISAPYPGNTATTSPVNARAIPYFFNATSPASLSYSWSVNNTSGGSAENPQNAVITLPASTPSGTNLFIDLTITNPSDGTSADASTNIVYTKQLL